MSDFIIETVSAGTYCGDCYRDVKGPAGESNLSMHVAQRLTSGACGCCDAEVVAGSLVDSGGESVVRSPERRKAWGDVFAKRFPYADERNHPDS